VSVGGLWSFVVLAIASVGMFVVPVALATTAFVAKRSNGLGAFGFVSGLGIPLLYVAYLNRRGPGDVCTTHPGGQSCAQEWSPWPWLAAAVLLIGIGLGLFGVQTRGHPKDA
jgi:hypothetical protein